MASITLVLNAELRKGGGTGEDGDRWYYLHIDGPDCTRFMAATQLKPRSRAARETFVFWSEYAAEYRTGISHRQRGGPEYIEIRAKKTWNGQTTKLYEFAHMSRSALPLPVRLYARCENDRVERVEVELASVGLAQGVQPASPQRAADGQNLVLREAERCLAAESVFDPNDETDARERVARAIVARRGQTRFRASLLSAYGRRCAVSGCGVEAVLEAAHIRPYKGPHTNHVMNGILLRSDLHTLFDLGLIGIDVAAGSLVVASSIQDSEYGALAGERLRFPTDVRLQPSWAALDAHRRSAGL